MTLRRTLALALAASFILTSCSAVSDIDKTKSTVNDNTDSTLKAINDAKGGKTVVAGQSYVHAHAFGGGTALLNTHGAVIPAATPKFDLNSNGAELSLRDIAQEITAQTHIPVDLDDSLPIRANTGPTAQGTTAASCKTVVDTGKMTLPEFLDTLATWCDLRWYYKEGRLNLVQYETVTYTLAATPTVDKISSVITSSGQAPTSSSTGGGNGASINSGSGNSNSASGQSLDQSTSVSAELDGWKQLQTVLAPWANPGHVEIAPAHRLVVVTAKHQAQKKIKELIDGLNRRHMQLVTFTMRVIEINTTNTIDIGTSLSSLYNNLQGQYLVSGASPASLAAQAAGAGSLTIAAQNNTVTGKKNKLANSSAAIQALQNIGHVSTDQPYSVNTLDGKPTGLTVARQITYFSGSSATQNTNSTLSGVQEQTMTVGLTVNLIPTVMDDGEIILQYNFGLSSLNGLNPTNQNGVTLDAPDINVQSAMQHTIVASGDTLLLLGYEQKSLNVTDQGIPGIAESLFGFFSGSKSLQNSHNVLAILITPQLRENSVSGQ